MRFHIFFLLSTLFLFLSESLNAANKDCDCHNILQQSIRTISENYALFKIKVNDNTRKQYDAFNQLHLKKAESIQNSAECQKLLNTWVSYFNDKHLWITVNSEDDKINYVSYPLQLKSYHKRWSDAKIPKDPIEGLWEMEGYRAAIVPDPKFYGQFNALVVSADNEIFKPGMLKMHLFKKENFYDMDFYRRDSTIVHSTIRFTSNHTLRDEDDIIWRRLEPTGINDSIPPLSVLNKYDPYQPTLKWLDEKSAIFTMQSCAPRYGRIVDSLINANKSNLEKCHNLIIDVRGNGGGSDRTYRALLPYVLQSASPLPKVGYYLSDENNKMFRELGILKKLNPADTGKRGTWATIAETPYLSASYYSKFPKKVAILMDSKTASSGETFVMKSTTSERVITFGSSTAGCVDGYNGNVIQLDGASVRYPTSIRTIDLPQNAVDPFGILPDIPVITTAPDAVSLVLEYLRNIESNN